MTSPEVTFTTLNNLPIALVPLLGDPAGRRAKVNADDWHRLSRRVPCWWMLEPGAPYECVVGVRRDEEPAKHSEMVARLIAQPEDGWAVLTHNEGATDLRRCNLYIRNVEAGTKRACRSGWRRARGVIKSPERIAVAA